MELSLAANNTLLRSADWELLPSDGILRHESSGWSWAVYRFSVVTFLDSSMLLSLLGQSEGSGARVHVGLPNYTTQRWDWYSAAAGDLPVAVPIDFSPARLKSGATYLDVAVVIPPNTATETLLSSVRLDLESALPPPQGLQVSYGNQVDGIHLNWTSAEYFQLRDPNFKGLGISVERSDDAGETFEQLEILPLLETAYLDAGQHGNLDPAAEYVYRLKYVNGNLEGGASAERKGRLGSSAIVSVLKIVEKKEGLFKVTLDASNSTVGSTDAGFSEFAWDLNEDGVYEFKSDSPVLATIIDIPGFGQPFELRLTDEFGLQTVFNGLIPYFNPSGLQVIDDENRADPGKAGSLVGSTGQYMIDFNYEIVAGLPPYAVDFDFDWGGSFNDGVAGRVVLIREIEVTTGSQRAIDVNVPASIPDGEYYMAVRVTDSTPPADNGPLSSIFVWQDKVNLGKFNAHDNEDAQNPGQTGTLSGGPGNYTVDMYIDITGSHAPFAVDYDFDFGSVWNDGPAGRVREGESTYLGYGHFNDANVPIPPIMPDGTYRVAVRVTDSRPDALGGPQSLTFVYPTLMTLVPQGP